jgi:hypothetical protein
MKPQLQKKNTKYIIGILIAVVVLLFGFIGYRITSTKPTYVTVRIKGSPGNWWWATPRPPDWLVNSVRVGDKEYNTVNKPTAEVVKVNIFDAGGSTKDIFLDVKLTISKNKQTNKYRYKGQSLEIGGPIALSLNNTFFPGIITKIDDGTSTPQIIKEQIIKIKIYDRWPFEFEAIKVGESMDDGAGNKIATILDKQQMPAEKEASTINGQIVRSYSPVKNDFILTIKIQVENIKGDNIFRTEQYVKVGNGIWIQFPSYNIASGHIMSIEN